MNKQITIAIDDIVLPSQSLLLEPIFIETAIEVEDTNGDKSIQMQQQPQDLFKVLKVADDVTQRGTHVFARVFMPDVVQLGEQRYCFLDAVGILGWATEE